MGNVKFKPEKWTHHHTQRLFHISISVCLVFAFFFALLGQVFILIRAQADVNQGMNISANVGQIQTGPGVVTSGGGGFVNNTTQATSSPIYNGIKPTLTVKLNPNLVVARKPLGLKLAQTEFVDVVNTQFPEFFGHTNINNAIIFLETKTGVIIKGAVYSDINGDWSWKASEPLNVGENSLSVLAQSQEDGSIHTRIVFNFIIEPSIQHPLVSKFLPELTPATYGLFDVLVKIPSQFKTVAPGEDLITNIKIVNFSKDGQQHDAVIEYRIENADGDIIMESSETIAVGTQVSITKSFRLLYSVPEGVYKLIVRVPSINLIASSSDNFQVKGKAIYALGTSKVDVTLIFQAMGILIFFFAVIGYLEYNKVTILTRQIKRVSENDLKLLPKT